LLFSSLAMLGRVGMVVVGAGGCGKTYLVQSLAAGAPVELKMTSVTKSMRTGKVGARRERQRQKKTNGTRIFFSLVRAETMKLTRRECTRVPRDAFLEVVMVDVGGQVSGVFFFWTFKCNAL
jgi:ATP-dependent protease Clp ATPase subunit